MKIIHKPWGREEWLELNDSYCYKRIYINAGYKTSYQYHHFKRETNYIISGEAEIWLENEEGIVEKKIMKTGEYFNVTPPKKHRVIAITDIILQEVSTPEVDDVIRIEDDTNRVDGKIEGEHKNPAVLILAAGFGTRLKNLTKNINKVLLPINNKAIISHIIDMFPKTYDFIIALGYKGNSIKDYCKITHPDYNFIFVDIDKFEGEDTGPGYSALLCANHLQRPFYFITGDCLIDSPLPHIDGNWLGVQPTSYPEKYSTIEVDSHNNVLSHKNKSEEGNDLAFIGMAGIFDYGVFWKELETNLINGEIVTAFQNPSLYPTLKVKELKWLDTGNLDDLTKTKEYFNDKPLSLKKETDEITYKDGGKFLKFTPNKNTLSKRISRADGLKNIIPNNFGYSDEFMYYDWFDGKTLYELDDMKIFELFLNNLEKNIKSQIPNSKIDIHNFYYDKTMERMSKFIDKYGYEYFELEHEINGVKRPQLKSVIENFNFTQFNDNPFYSLFHGDLQFDNVIYNGIDFIYIDWRDSFADNVIGGDIYYDLAKLYGGLLIPYNLMKEEDKITFNEGSYSITYNYPISDNLKKFKLSYELWLNEQGFDLNKVKLLTGLIFLNMSPLHDGKFGKMLWFKSIEMFDNYDK
jgi:NDP-sugar pyrophosphorylase family protein/mannose-6-phosphate isomerase-like protein (cupin superfamily)/thiamine kinase-like enzyme